MTSLDPSHIPQLAARDKHTGDPAVVPVRPRSGSGSGTQVNIATIPDLRFEQSYLKSIAPYVQTRRVPGGMDGEEGREVIGVEWRQVLWITTRDQLVSPLLQGALWGVAQLFVRPLFANIRAFFGFSRRSPVADSTPSTRSKPKGEGELTRRLREWSKSLTGGLETNIALAK